MADKYLTFDKEEEIIVEKEGVVVSSGPADAGKLVALDKTGKLDASVLPDTAGGGTGTGGGGTGTAPSDKGVFGGGMNLNLTFNTIDYITISVLGDALDFGDLVSARCALAGTSNGVNDRGVFGGGHRSSLIDYITISTPSNATTFGDLSVTRWSLSATSNGTNDRGVFGGGIDLNLSRTSIIDYITISTPGTALAFGDLTIARSSLAATSNGTNDRGVFGGGLTGSVQVNTIDYITILTLGNALDFGDLTIERSSLAATSNGTNDTGVFGGNWTDDSSIEYITISTLGNAQYFGELTVGRCYLAATSNGTNDRGVFGGGTVGGTTTFFNTIDYITISLPGNASDFGDLTLARDLLAATSNA